MSMDINTTLVPRGTMNGHADEGLTFSIRDAIMSSELCYVNICSGCRRNAVNCDCVGRP